MDLNLFKKKKIPVPPLPSGVQYMPTHIPQVQPAVPPLPRGVPPRPADLPKLPPLPNLPNDNEGLTDLPPLPPIEDVPQLPDIKKVPELAELPNLGPGVKTAPAPRGTAAKVFVRLDRYQDILNTVNQMESKIEELQVTIRKISDVKAQEKQIVDNWNSLLSEARQRITEVHSKLPRPGEE